MDEVINTIMLNDWKLPCDGNFKGQYRGDLKEKQYLEVTCYLFILRAMYELTHKDSWFGLYQKALFEYPNGSKKIRVEICASGYLTDTTLFRNLNKRQLWIYVKNQATLIKLASMEDNETIREFYSRGIVKNINNAIEVIEDYKNFDNKPLLRKKTQKDLVWNNHNGKLRFQQFHDWNHHPPKQ